MNSQKSIIKYILGIVVIAAVVVGGYFIFKDKTVAGGASLRKIPAISVGCRPTMGANGRPVAPTPSITVISPNGGETFMIGQQITVKWTSCNIPTNETVLIEMVRANSINNPSGSWTLLSSATPNDGSETFTLNNHLALGTYELAVKRNSALAGDDISDNLFSILNTGNTSIVTTSVMNSASIMTVGPGANDDAGEFVIKFTVTAVGGDAYLPKTFAKAVGDAAQVEHNNLSVTQGVTYNLSTANSGLIVTPNNNYVIPDGYTATFWVTGVASLPTAGTAGAYRMVLSSVKWSPTDSVNPTQINLFNPTYNTNYLTLN